jgi:leucyl/phenylalanyl-tRNA--protein transferase
MSAVHIAVLSALCASVLATVPPAFAYGSNGSARAGLCERGLRSEFDRAPDDQRHGLVTDRMEINKENLLNAYRRGLFPWGSPDGRTGEWFSPPRRGVLDLERLRIGRSDMKFIRRHLDSPEYTITFDQAFPQVVRACARMPRFTSDPITGATVRAPQWLTDVFIEQYTALYESGHAHSVEVWHHGELVAGLYGVFVDGMYSGESMFHKESDSAKLALYALTQRLKAGGHRYIDTQMAIGLSGKWGAYYVPRSRYLKILREAHRRDLPY